MDLTLGVFVYVAILAAALWFLWSTGHPWILDPGRMTIQGAMTGAAYFFAVPFVLTIAAMFAGVPPLWAMEATMLAAVVFLYLHQVPRRRYPVQRRAARTTAEAFAAWAGVSLAAGLTVWVGVW